MGVSFWKIIPCNHIAGNTFNTQNTIKVGDEWWLLDPKFWYDWWGFHSWFCYFCDKFSLKPSWQTFADIFSLFVSNKITKFTWVFIRIHYKLIQQSYNYFEDMNDLDKVVKWVYEQEIHKLWMRVFLCMFELGFVFFLKVWSVCVLFEAFIVGSDKRWISNQVCNFENFENYFKCINLITQPLLTRERKPIIIRHDK